MFGLGAPELIVIAIVILALFGYKKLPDAARSVGRSMRIFKAEMHQMRGEDVVAAPPDPAAPNVITGEALPPANPHTVPPRSEPVTGGDA